MKPITITIPAATGTGNGILNYNAVGKYFLTKACDNEFLLQTDTGESYDFSSPGDRFGNDNSRTFKKLFFANPNGVAINVTFYASKTPIGTPDANITSTINVSASITNTLPLCALETEGQFQVTSTGATQRFAAPGTYWRRMIVIAQKSLDRTANTGNVYIGNSVAHQSIALQPGDTWTVEADTGAKRDFGSWYCSADTSGDGVSVLYV
jgi:hypothetical protein